MLRGFAVNNKTTHKTHTHTHTHIRTHTYINMHKAGLNGGGGICVNHSALTIYESDFGGNLATNITCSEIWLNDTYISIDNNSYLSPNWFENIDNTKCNQNKNNSFLHYTKSILQTQAYFGSDATIEGRTFITNTSNPTQIDLYFNVKGTKYVIEYFFMPISYEQIIYLAVYYAISDITKSY